MELPQVSTCNVSDTLIFMSADLTSIKFSDCTSILSNSAVTDH